MNELKDGQLLAEISIREPQSLSGSGINFDLLADQLSSIASELRRAGISLPRELFNPASAIGTTIRSQSSIATQSKLGFDNSIQIRAAHADAARQAYANRRRRTALFGNAELFGEPAWDIMLDLYIAHAEGKPVSVSSACIGSAAPPTTGLRWLGVLADNDLVLREHDPEDQRRVMVRLTDRGLAAMDGYFATPAGPT